LAVGASNSFNENENLEFYVVKFDTYGNTIWTKTFPDPGNLNYLAQNVFETSYGSYLVAGSIQPDYQQSTESYLVEFMYPVQFGISFESDKQIVTSPPFSVQFTNKTSNSEYYDFVWFFGDGKSLASNETSVFHEYEEEGLYNVKLVAFENDFGLADSVVFEDYIYIEGSITSVVENESVQTQILNIQPNPLVNKAIIGFDNPENDPHTLRIIDLNGKLIKEIDNIRGTMIEINRSDLPSGIYVVELSGRIPGRARLLVE